MKQKHKSILEFCFVCKPRSILLIEKQARDPLTSDVSGSTTKSSQWDLKATSSYHFCNSLSELQWNLSIAVTIKTATSLLWPLVLVPVVLILCKMNWIKQLPV